MGVVLQCDNYTNFNEHMQDIIQQLTLTVDILRMNFPIVLMILAILWGIHFVNWSIGYRLNIFGIYPRHPFGLIGIPASPFLHGHFNHIFFNSIPLVILASFILLNGLHHFLIISMIIIVLCGFATWLFGRPSIHIGASGVIMGYLGYCLVAAYSQPGVISVAIGLVCIYYFGSMLFSIFPSDVRTSWEAHLFGLMAGVASIYIAPFIHF